MQTHRKQGQILQIPLNRNQFQLTTNPKKDEMTVKRKMIKVRRTTTKSTKEVINKKN